MTKRIIHVADHRFLQAVPLVPAHLAAPTGNLRDQLERPLHDLRISVTDRCNFRCVYCMPKETFGKDYAFLPQSAMLSFEEITRLARLFIEHGVEKIRLTGGEPLLRKHLEKLVGMLARLPTPSGRPLDLTLTTNGALLARRARALADAGLSRVTVSLDALDETTFQRMNDVDFPVADVLRGIEAAQAAGLGPVKVNMVVKRGLNEQEIVPMARHFKDTLVILRFIEYMDVGASNGWKLDEVIPSAEVVRRIDASMPLEALAPNYAGETASRWRYRDGGGEVGMISSVTGAFCGSCTRARLSTEGKLFTCLFASAGSDLRGLLRSGRSDAEISGAIGQLWQRRSDRYSEQRLAATSMAAPFEGQARRVEMSYIGG
ncbi:MAG: GTP 3',8-cyclase MoaA [Janthinobacterium lividum]